MTTTQTKSPEKNGIPIQIATASSLYSGPLPPPEAFEKYERTLPGASNRIFELAEGEANHRRKIEEAEANHRRQLEKKTVDHNIIMSHMGQLCAFVLGISGIAGSVYCASIHEPIVAGVIVGSSLATLIAPFLKKPRD